MTDSTLRRTIERLIIENRNSLNDPTTNEPYDVKGIADDVEALCQEIAREAKYQILQDLLDWQDFFEATHKVQKFNWYGAIKAMQVMKEPQKPFVELTQKPAEGTLNATFYQDKIELAPLTNGDLLVDESLPATPIERKTT